MLLDIGAYTEEVESEKTSRANGNKGAWPLDTGSIHIVLIRRFGYIFDPRFDPRLRF